MNALMGLTNVTRSVRTALAPTPVPVVMAMCSMRMDTNVMVCMYANYCSYNSSSC